MTNTNASMLLKFLILLHFLPLIFSVSVGIEESALVMQLLRDNITLWTATWKSCQTRRMTQWPSLSRFSLVLVFLSVGFCMSWFHVVLAMLHGFLIYSHYSLKFERIRHWNDIRSVRLCRTSDPSWWPREFHCGCCAATSYTFWQETLPSCHFCKRQMSKFDLELSWI